jgi:hypothetical protein
VNKLLALLKNPKVHRAVGAFVAALAAQPAVQALLGGTQPLSTTLAVSALLGAAVAVLEKYLPKG